jgi:hypothetical protein
MLLSSKKIVQPASQYPDRHRVEPSEPRSNITVVFTSVESSVAALKKAGSLADSLGARITLVVPQLVPYPLPLDNPPVQSEWNENRLEALASACPVETSVVIYLCRDRLRMLKSVLQSGSIVVVGCRNSARRASDMTLARELQDLGHVVMLIKAE